MLVEVGFLCSARPKEDDFTWHQSEKTVWIQDFCSTEPSSAKAVYLTLNRLGKRVFQAKFSLRYVFYDGEEMKKLTPLE